MQFNFPFLIENATREKRETLLVGRTVVKLHYVRSPRARRYILRIEDAETVRVTLPRSGSLREARQFAERQAQWMLRHLDRLRQEAREPKRWQAGTEILFRGEQVPLVVNAEVDSTCVTFAEQTVEISGHPSDLRPGIESFLRSQASLQLPPRVRELAAEHDLSVKRITVRNQSTRWGSCSPKRTISLNWRLIQLPCFVRDYIILHELMHLHELNHSRRFWAKVANACPRYREAERWLKSRGPRLR